MANHESLPRSVAEIQDDVFASEEDTLRVFAIFTDKFGDDGSGPSTRMQAAAVYLRDTRPDLTDVVMFAQEAHLHASLLKDEIDSAKREHRTVAVWALRYSDALVNDILIRQSERDSQEVLF